MKRFLAALAIVGATVVGGLAVASPAQADIAEGFSLLQAGFCDPKDPQPWARQAMEKFNKAFTEIATKKAI